MKKLRISAVARNQYRQLCPVSSRKDDSINYKISRAVDLGKVTHNYQNGCKVIRYYYLNIMISDFEVMAIWKDRELGNSYEVDENVKRLHKDLFYYSKYDLEDVEELVRIINKWKY